MRVTEDELDSAFNDLERADHNLSADLGFVGILVGAAVSQHSPVPDLTVDLSGPAAIYNQLGERIFFSSLQNVNVAVDDNGVSTAVSAPGEEKILSVFARFDRALSDPRVDGNSLTVFFRRDESFRFVVVQGAQAVAGTALPPPLRADAILLADITRTFGQSQILNTDTSAARRQDAFVATGTPRSIRTGQTRDAIGELLTFQNAHVLGTADRHSADAIDYAGGQAWADGTANPAATVEAQLDKIVANLAATTGSPKIGTTATPGTPNSLAAGTVRAQLDALLGFINGHVNTGGAHAATVITYAGGGSWADGTTNPATTVEGELDKIIADLAGASGAAKIGASTTVGTPGTLPGGSIKSQVDALLGQLNLHITSASGGVHAASAIAYAGGPNWRGGRTNPATTVAGQLDKLIADLGSQLADDDGAERIGAQTVTGSPSNLSAGSVRSQLDQLLALVNGTARTNVGQTWTATQIVNGPTGEENPSLATTVSPVARKLLWAVTGGDYGLRIYYTARTIEIVLNARWTGTEWTRDNTGLLSARFISNNFETRWQLQAGGGDQFSDAEWSGIFSKQFVFPIDSLGIGQALIIGREYDVSSGPLTGYSGTEGEWAAGSTANIGAGASFASGRLPAIPSSVTFTVHTQQGTANSPSVIAPQRQGVGWFDETLSGGPTTRLMFVSFSAT